MLISEDVRVPIGATVRINIALDFTARPGGRHRTPEDLFSGEEFRESILLPRFDEAAKTDAQVFIDLDGGRGYSTSFLEEAFGGLARKRGVEPVLSRLHFKSEDEPYLEADIRKYIREARD